MANWVTLRNGVHIDLDDPNNPITGSGSFKDLDIENQIKELEASRQGLSFFDPKRAKISEKINELKQKLAEKTKSESANNVKTNPKTEQMKIRMQVETAKKVSEHQKEQFEIIQKNNPMLDDYHTGIRKASDIKTFSEAIEDDESFAYPDYTKEDAMIALKTGRIRVYSSKPISQGGFISPSQMMAQDYAGSGKVYSQVVNVEDIAWINGDEGQYAKVKK